MRRPSCSLLTATLLLAFAGCAFEASELDPGLRCGADGRCPSGQSCVAYVCVEPGNELNPDAPDAPLSTVDADPLAPDADPAVPDAAPPDADPGCTATVCPAATLVDDFESGGIGPLWFSWSSPTSCTISEIGGTIRMVFPGTTASLYCGVDAEAHYDLRDSAIYADAGGASSASFFATFFQLSVPGDFSTRVEIVREQSSLISRQHVGGTISPSRTVTYDPIAHRYWRMRGAGGRVFFEASANASTWTALFDIASQVDLSELVVTLGAGHYMAPGGSVTASFGGVNVP